MPKTTPSKFFSLLVFSFFSLTLMAPALTQARGVRRVSFKAATLAPLTLDHEKIDQVDCSFISQEKPEYKAKFLSLRKKGKVETKQLFETKVFILNTGNMPWFASDSGCTNNIVNLGTDKERDRSSIFYIDELIWKSNWLSPSRITMETKRVDPGKIATFTFWSKAPEEDGYYREFYTPLVEGITWMDEGKFQSDTTVGEPDMDPAYKDLLQYYEKSANLASIDFSGERSIEVDLSEQRMNLKVGEEILTTFPVSSGKRSTPTPVGTTTITQKQEVRIASKSPHYIMPKFMMFRKGGYGIHALPSLGNDNGVFWKEALSHIGSPRSHGCVRLLPEHSEVAFKFAEVGTKVVVKY